jgi:phosphate transport system substrate-binding protein
VTQAVHEIITPAKEARNADGTPNPLAAQENCSFDRPNGSGEGQAALRLSVNPSSTAAIPGGANPPQQGCVDIARSSGSPSASGFQSTSGQLIFIPFGLDAVTTSTGSTAATITIPGTSTVVNTPASNVQGADFTLAQLQAMYSAGTPETASNGKTYNPTGGPTALQAGQVAIDLYVPQPGSGTRSFWATTMGFSNTSLPAWVFDHIQSDGGNTVSQFVNASVEEHDGTAVTVDPNGFAPFSVAQYIAQTNGHNPRFHQAVLDTIGGVQPIVSGALNTSFPVTREVYNVVQYDRVVNTGDGKFDSQLAKLLVGTTSTLCRDSLTITGYGFGLLGASTTDTCGSTAATLRAYATV